VLLRVLNSFYQFSLKRREVATATALIVTHMQRARLYWSELLDSEMLKSEAVRREGRERPARRVV
jgi:hypothetical protein